MRTMKQSGEHVNRYVRKGGRGVRPWLLIPKVLALAIFVGGYAAASVLWIAYRMGIGDSATWAVPAVSAIFRWVIVPALISTLLFGVLLVLQHPVIFLQRRWLQVKLLFVLILPAIHFVARKTFQEIKAVLAGEAELPAAGFETACARFTICIVGGLLCAVGILVLGRLKPRLGQTPRTLPTVACSEIVKGGQ